MRLLRLVLLVPLLSACALTKSTQEQAAQTDWKRCAVSIEKAQCSEATGYGDASGLAIASGFGAAGCVAALREKYAATRPAGKKGFLVRHGCPRNVAGLSSVKKKSSPSTAVGFGRSSRGVNPGDVREREVPPGMTREEHAAELQKECLRAKLKNKPLPDFCGG